MRDWSSDVCSSDLFDPPLSLVTVAFQIALFSGVGCSMPWSCSTLNTDVLFAGMPSIPCESRCARSLSDTVLLTSQSASWVSQPSEAWGWRSEEHTSELQSLMRISYAVFCLKKKKKTNINSIRCLMLL